MRLIVDGDACPVKELIHRASRRLGVTMVLVSNRPLSFAAEAPDVEAIVVPQGPDVADAWIAAHCGPGDIVITADIPLAAACVEAGAIALGHRGEIFDEASIGDRMASWALNRSLREQGLDLGGPKAYGPRDRTAFATGLEKLVARELAAARRRQRSP